MSQQIQIQPHGDGTFAVNFPPGCIHWDKGRFYAQVTESQLRELLNETLSHTPHAAIRTDVLGKVMRGQQ